MLAADDQIWDRVVEEVAELMSLLILTVSPQRIVLGGGVMRDRSPLLPRIHERTAHLLAGYVANASAADLAGLIVQPALGADAGPLGAVALALERLGS